MGIWSWGTGKAVSERAAEVEEGKRPHLPGRTRREHRLFGATWGAARCRVALRVTLGKPPYLGIAIRAS